MQKKFRRANFLDLKQILVTDFTHENTNQGVPTLCLPDTKLLRLPHADKVSWLQENDEEEDVRTKSVLIDALFIAAAIRFGSYLPNDDGVNSLLVAEAEAVGEVAKSPTGSFRTPN